MNKIQPFPTFLHFAAPFDLVLSRTIAQLSSATAQPYFSAVLLDMLLFQLDVPLPVCHVFTYTYTVDVHK